MPEISLPEDNPFMKALVSISDQVIADDDSNTLLFTPERKAIALDLQAVERISTELSMQAKELDDFCHFHSVYSLSTFLEQFADGRELTVTDFQSICSGLLLQGILVGARYNRDRAIELERLVEGDK